ncbi:MAG: hypothetical protein AAFV29_24370, partial [Myxococcota bacterium]
PSRRAYDTSARARALARAISVVKKPQRAARQAVSHRVQAWGRAAAHSSPPYSRTGALKGAYA